MLPCNLAFHENLWIVYDVESTSKIPTEDHVISLGAVICSYDSKQFQALGSFHTYVNTNRPIDPVAQSIHHISAQSIATAPAFPAALEKFQTWVRSFLKSTQTRTFLVAHNGTKFDDLIMFCNCVVHGIQYEAFLSQIRCHGFVDTLKMLRAVLKNCPMSELPKDQTTSRVSFALGNCYTSFCSTQPFENAHDALADSFALVDVLNSTNIQRYCALQQLFLHVVPKEKALKYLQDTAGVSFRRRLDFALTKKAKGNTIISEEFDVAFTQQRTTEHAPRAFDTSSSSFVTKNLCLNCITFYDPGTHEVCS